MLRKIIAFMIFLAGCVFVTGCNNKKTTLKTIPTITTKSDKPNSTTSGNNTNIIISTTETNYLFASPDGEDTGDGSAIDPYSLAKALQKMKAGSIVYLIPGTYEITGGINLNTAGSEAHPNSILALGEGAIFDFQEGSGLTIAGSYWYLYNISFTNCFTGANYKGACTVNGNGNIIEYCRAYNNRTHGFYLSSAAADNKLISCTSKFNKYGGGIASGFYLSGSGTGNMLNVCLAFRNEDSGFDITATKQIIFMDCLAIENGVFEDGTVNSDSAGTKAGFAFYDKNHVFENCTAYENEYGFYAKGNNDGSFKISNSSAIDNKIINFRLYNGNTTMELDNVLSYNEISSSYQDDINGYCKNSLFCYKKDGYYYTGAKSNLIDSMDSSKRGTKIDSSNYSINTLLEEPFDIVGKKKINIGTFLNRNEDFQDDITSVYFGAKY